MSWLDDFGFDGYDMEEPSGESSIQCEYCGSIAVHWVRTKNNKWMLCNIGTSTYHDCPEHIMHDSPDLAELIPPNTTHPNT